MDIDDILNESDDSSTPEEDSEDEEKDVKSVERAEAIKVEDASQEDDSLPIAEFPNAPKSANQAVDEKNDDEGDE